MNHGSRVSKVFFSLVVLRHSEAWSSYVRSFREKIVGSHLNRLKLSRKFNFLSQRWKKAEATGSHYKENFIICMLLDFLFGM